MWQSKLLARHKTDKSFDSLPCPVSQSEKSFHEEADIFLNLNDHIWYYSLSELSQNKILPKVPLLSWVVHEVKTLSVHSAVCREEARQGADERRHGLNQPAMFPSWFLLNLPWKADLGVCREPDLTSRASFQVQIQATYVIQYANSWCVDFNHTHTDVTLTKTYFLNVNRWCKVFKKTKFY